MCGLTYGITSAAAHNVPAHLMLRPIGLETEVVHIWLLPSSGMTEERRKNSSPITLGNFELHRDRIEGLIGIPADVLSPILQMLIAK